MGSRKLTRCPTSNDSSFEWTLFDISKEEFHVVHKESNKCLGLNADLELTLFENCNQSSAHIRWKFPSRNETNTKPNEDMEGTSSVTEIALYSAISLVVIAAFIMCIAGGLYLKLRTKRLTKLTLSMIRRESENANRNTYDMERSLDTLTPDDSWWEFPLTKIKIGKELGSGAFGKVVIATALGINDNEEETTVAVKMLCEYPDTSQFEALKRELQILINVGQHINVVNLLGACTKHISNNQLWIILEFCKYGNLRSYMHSHRNTFKNDLILNDDYIRANQMTNSYVDHQRNDTAILEDKCSGYFDMNKGAAIKTTDLLCWAYGIANGMEYLTSKGIVHGDLAARNILLAENNVVKICDFGLAKEINSYYEYKTTTHSKSTQLPVKWMAIESLELGIFSPESDCWSFGVVLWELFTLGESPYAGIQFDSKFIERLKEGYRMSKPAYAPGQIYDVMLQFWDEDRSKRPKVSKLVDVLKQWMRSSINQYYTILYDENERFEDKGKPTRWEADRAITFRRDEFSTYETFVKYTRKNFMKRSLGDMLDERKESGSGKVLKRRVSL